ncbi:Hypothetical protein NTJ_12883 [Nesidiocoris tenuis]|uniref:THAP-type domain-containing protein n=1 Tax=Nesidiocoris tenuis TaxID=355587 RepID=A0ABN7BA81_9HEMI|nr:Hypothetical protein NTJ_12883 [Nesidiocoris tenuis]
MLQVAGNSQPPASDMAQNEEEDDEQMSDSDEMPYIKCEAVYGEGGDDDEMSALPFVRTEMKEDEEEDESERMKYGMKAPEVGAYVKCSVPSCHSYFEVGNPKYEGFSHFKFPEETDLRKKWISIIGQKEDWEPEGAMICSIHFTDGCFINVMEANQDTGLMMAKRTLKKGAVPTMNLEVPNSWTMQRVVIPPSTNGSGSPVPGAPPSAARQLAPTPGAVPSPNTIRSPYCQGETSTNINIEDYYSGRAITLTKNGKRRGRPPKNRSLDASPYGSPIGNTTITPSPSQILKSAQPSSHTNGQAKQANLMAKLHQTYANQAQQMMCYNQNMQPFQILDMGKRKRGRPRKEVSLRSSWPNLGLRELPPNSKHDLNHFWLKFGKALLSLWAFFQETLRRLAEGAAENVFGWKNAQQNHWQRNPQLKRRRILPIPPQTDQAGRVVQLECNIDPGHFFMNEEPDCNDVDYCDRELAYFRKLPNVLAAAGLNSSSLAELRTIVQAAVERLSATELAIRKSAVIENHLRSRSLSGGASITVKPSTATKERLLDVDVRIPPSVSIKPVPMKSKSAGSNGGGSSSVSEEDLKPALTITIRRDKGSSETTVLNGVPHHMIKDDSKSDDGKAAVKEEKEIVKDDQDSDDEGELKINEDFDSDGKTSEDGDHRDGGDEKNGRHGDDDDQQEQDGDRHDGDQHDEDQHDGDRHDGDQHDEDQHDDDQQEHDGNQQDDDDDQQDEEHDDDQQENDDCSQDDDDGSLVDSSVAC